MGSHQLKQRYPLSKTLHVTLTKKHSENEISLDKNIISSNYSV
jgi:hypothetical protein